MNSSTAVRIADADEGELDLSLVIPCLNERKTLGAVVEKGLGAIRRLGLRGEVLVADNGSTDGSVEIARSLGARVVSVPARGYGNALRFGMSEARGRMLIMGDADDTYDFSAIDPFVEKMQAGAEFVMGTRLSPGKIMPGANPFLNRYLGTPVLTFVLNRLFGTGIRDVNCGMRGITKSQFLRLGLRSEGMEFASEMVIKAALHELKVEEVPITLYPDRRGRPPHLRRWSDGWRHLEFMLLHAPDQLLFFPGMLAFLVGILASAPVAFGPQTLFGRFFDFHILFFGGTLSLIGLQGVLGALLARDLVGGIVWRPSRLAASLSRGLTLFRGLALASALSVAGVALESIVVGIWIRNGFSNLHEPRRSVVGMLLLGMGSEIGLFSFLHAVLKKHRPERSP